MNNTIYKYPLEFRRTQYVHIPPMCVPPATTEQWCNVINGKESVSASLIDQVRLVDVQSIGVGRSICLWCEVCPMEAEVKRTVYILGTGEDVEPHMVHIGSVIDCDHNVWHVYTRGY